jgi:pimeloyl-ACP methyl ester carboxylesterase
MPDVPLLLPLGDRRTLAISEFGAPDGVPLLYCHGWPSSRLEAAFLQQAAQRLGVRILAADRPGMGRSTRLPARRLLDWPADVARIADHFDIDGFHLLGVSGGAPYALACAQAMPGRVKACSIVCGLGPLDGAGAAQLAPARFAMLQAGWRTPKLMAVKLQALRCWLAWSPQSFVRYFSRHYPPGDLALMLVATNLAQWRAMVLESFRQGVTGVVDDAAILAGDWGFPPAAIECRVDLWHGERDTIVPIAMARAMAAAIPHARSHLYPEDGHFSIVVQRAEAALAALIAAP